MADRLRRIVASKQAEAYGTLHWRAALPILNHDFKHSLFFRGGVGILGENWQIRRRRLIDTSIQRDACKFIIERDRTHTDQRSVSGVSADALHSELHVLIGTSTGERIAFENLAGQHPPIELG